MALEITPEIIAAFRAKFGGLFADETKWSDDTVTEALCEGDAETGSCRWGVYQDICSNFKQRGMFYYAAHWLITTYPSAAGATDPSKPSVGAKYTTASKSVGDESIAFVNSKGNSELAAGDEWLTTTSYGQQYLRLRRRAGMGAVVV